MSHVSANTGPDDAPRLLDEHSFLERLLDEAIALADAKDWRRFELKWDAFGRAAEQHMQYEENLLLPAFARSGATAQKVAERLRADHASLRDELRFLDAETQLTDLFVEQLRYLTQALRVHKEHEESMMYPWLSSLPATEIGTESAHETAAAAASAPVSAGSSAWENPARHELEILRSNR